MDKAENRRINKIVVCSDGTGQSGGMLNPSNVWRLYLALNKQTQSCFHDDGVGTGGNRFFRAIGGAFGLGISRNLKQIYKYLITQYEPGQENQLFFFGFSRGAFTVRVLAQMVCLFGIPDKRGKSPAEIQEMADTVLRNYKTANSQFTSSLKAKSNHLEGAGPIRGRSELAERIAINHHVKDQSKRVHFLGVWDTVEAIGLPIDEFTRAFSKLFPLKFGNNKPNSNIGHIAQALSIDEERRTFTPRLFDERGFEPVDKGSGNQRSIRQVWFPGCHAHVGGGYAKDQLALNSLVWMIGRATELGLDVDPAKVKKFAAEAAYDGQLLDSRTGLRMFYRYGPRNIERLCSNNGVQTVLHESAWRRIEQQIDGYSPSALAFEGKTASCEQPPFLIEQFHSTDDTKTDQVLDFGICDQTTTCESDDDQKESQTEQPAKCDTDPGVASTKNRESTRMPLANKQRHYVDPFAGKQELVEQLRTGLYSARRMTRSRGLVSYGMFFIVLILLGFGCYYGLQSGGKEFSYSVNLPRPLADLEVAVLDILISVTPGFVDFLFHGLKRAPGIPLILCALFAIFFFGDKQAIVMIRDSADLGWRGFRSRNGENSDDPVKLENWRDWLCYHPVSYLAVVFALGLVVLAFVAWAGDFESLQIKVQQGAVVILGLLFLLLAGILIYGFVVFSLLSSILRLAAKSMEFFMSIWVVRNSVRNWRDYASPVIGFGIFIVAAVLIAAKGMDKARGYLSSISSVNLQSTGNPTDDQGQGAVDAEVNGETLVESTESE